MALWHRSLGLPTIVVTLGMFFALPAIFHPPAFAQGRLCADDVAKFCKDIQGGRGGIMQCLQEHQTELSPQCQARVQAFETRMNKMKDACESDVQQFCNDISPGSGRLAACLRSHESEISAACKAELTPARSRRRSNR